MTSTSDTIIALNPIFPEKCAFVKRIYSGHPMAPWLLFCEEINQKQGRSERNQLTIDEMEERVREESPDTLPFFEVPQQAPRERARRIPHWVHRVKPRLYAGL